MIEKYSQILDSALEHGKTLHPDAPIEHHAAFANSVAYLVTGASGGYGGPSCREHAVSWALHGSRHSSIAGEWEYEKALQFAEPYCYGPLTELHYQCAKSECCFHDSLEDIEQIKKYLEGIANP